MNSRVLLTLAIVVILLAAGYALLKPGRTAVPKAVVASPPPVEAKPPRVEAIPQPIEAQPTPETHSSTGEAQPTPAQRAQPATPVADSLRGAGPTIYAIEARGGRRISEPVITVQQGDEVRLRIISDVPDEFHLHGYNLHVAVSPGRSGMLQFTAKLTGRFPYELHKSGLELGALEVYPK